MQAEARSPLSPYPLVVGLGSLGFIEPGREEPLVGRTQGPCQALGWLGAPSHGLQTYHMFTHAITYSVFLLYVENGETCKSTCCV